MTARVLRSLLGPRIPKDELQEHRGRYVLPTVLLVCAAVLLLISIFTPYWQMTLHAPQYPKGLTVYAYLTHLTGDVSEIDGLNHYIGMRPLNEAAQLERSLAIMMVCVLGLLILGAIFIHSKWAALLVLPAVLYPVGFLADLWYWLNNFGQNLDPRAALSSTIKPFTPPVLGPGYVGQFKTVALPHLGLTLASAASILILLGLWYHRRAYKPLVDAQQSATRESSS